MPLVTESNPFNKAPKEPTYNAEVSGPEYRHSIVDSDKVPIDSLLTHIEGMSWTVDYYSQILGADDEVNDYNPSELGPYQQYQKIVKYEVKLQGDLSSSFDSAQNRANVTGTAITYPKLKPNKGDVLVGDIGDGRAGRFTVTNVTQKSIFNNSVYEIDFELASILTRNETEILDSHVVKTVYFDRDFLLFGQNPLLVSEEYQLKTRLDKTISEVLSSWLSEFYSYEIQSIQVPQINKIVFDPFLTLAMVRVFGTRDHPVFAKLSMYNCDEQTFSNYTDIWSAFISGEEYILKMAFSKYQLVHVKQFSNNIHLRGIRFSNIDYVVMPAISGPSLSDPLDVLGFDSGVSLDVSGADVPDEDKEPVVDGLGAPSMIDTNQYVVSKDCYELEDKQETDIEQQICNYFQGEKLNPSKIFRYTDERDKLDPLERFYLMPACLFMMMVLLREI